MDKGSAIFWAVVWGIIFILAIAAMFWNPCHIATAVISGVFCGLFIHDYRKTKGM